MHQIITRNKETTEMRPLVSKTKLMLVRENARQQDMATTMTKRIARRGNQKYLNKI